MPDERMDVEKAHADKMRGFALAEVEDAVRLVEKITAVGGEPDVDVKPPSWTADPVKALDSLIATCCAPAVAPTERFRRQDPL